MSRHLPYQQDLSRGAARRVGDIALAWLAPLFVNSFLRPTDRNVCSKQGWFEMQQRRQD